MYNISDEFLEYVKRGQEGYNKGHPFTIKAMNGLISGILPATYYLILGPSGSGKSTLLYEQFIFNFVDLVYNGKLDIKDIKIVLFSLEISPVKFYSKATSRFLYKKFFNKTKRLISSRDIANVTGKEDELMYKMLYGNKLKEYLRILDIIVDVYTNVTPAGANRILSNTLAKLSKKIGEDREGKPIYRFNNKNQKFIAALDHISLTDNLKGDLLKATIDKMSKKVFVRYRNSHGITIAALQQITPNDENMKKVVYSHKDARDSKNTYHDCDVCLSIGSPLEAEKLQIQFNNGFYFVIPDESNNWQGLGNRIRVIAKEKDRDGESFMRTVVGFIGEVGTLTDLGKPEDVNYELYENLGK